MNKDLYKAAVDDIKVNEKFIEEVELKMREKQRKVNKLSTFGIAAASLAVVITAGIFLYDTVGVKPGKDVAQVDKAHISTSKDAKADTIYVNKLEGIRSAKLFIPEDAYSKDYTIDQLKELFGRNPVPAMPKDFKAVSDTTNITFEANGKILFMSALSYSKDINNPEAASIDVKLNKGKLPPTDCIYASETKESVIGSTKVTIGSIALEDKSEIYSAQFIYDGIGYNLTASKVDKDTFIDLLKSIIK